jgi:large subunit ribosomal protein L7/L12
MSHVLSQDDILNAEAEMSVLQVVELIRIEKFGVSAAAASAGPVLLLGVKKSKPNHHAAEAGEKKLTSLKQFN